MFKITAPTRQAIGLCIFNITTFYYIIVPVRLPMFADVRLSGSVTIGCRYSVTLYKKELLREVCLHIKKALSLLGYFSESKKLPLILSLSLVLVLGITSKITKA